MVPTYSHSNPHEALAAATATEKLRSIVQILARQAAQEFATLAAATDEGAGDAAPCTPQTSR